MQNVFSSFSFAHCQFDWAQRQHKTIDYKRAGNERSFTKSQIVKAFGTHEVSVSTMIDTTYMIAIHEWMCWTSWWNHRYFLTFVKSIRLAIEWRLDKLSFAYRMQSDAALWIHNIRFIVAKWKWICSLFQNGHLQFDCAVIWFVHFRTMVVTDKINWVWWRCMHSKPIFSKIWLVLLWCAQKRSGFTCYSTIRTDHNIPDKRCICVDPCTVHTDTSCSTTFTTMLE